MKSTLIFFVLSLAVLAWSCQSEPDAKELIDQLVVSTNYDTEADFTSYSTYAIPTDTIGFISNTSPDTIITSSKSTFPQPVINAIKSNMNAIGYAQVAKNQNPDLGVNVLVVNNFDVFQQVVYPSYYYGGYYGYSSYYYYPYVNTYASNTGILIVEIVDLKNKTPDNKVKVIWSSYMGDIYSTLDLIQQSTDAIDQAFIQSPYLGK